MDDKLIERALERVHTSTIARITKLNKDHSSCSVELLKKFTFNGKDEAPPVIDNVPILQIFSSPVISVGAAYAVGGKVKLSFFDTCHLEALNTKNITGSSRKDKFNINDCFVERAIKENPNVVNPFPEDYYVKNHISGEHFRMKSSGGGEYHGNFKIVGALEVSQEIKAGGEIEDGNGLKVSREHRYHDNGSPNTTEVLPGVKE